MKLNWGHKIILSFVFFFMIMGTLIYKSVNTDFQLVAPNYYEQEIAYQDKIDAINRAVDFPLDLKLEGAYIEISCNENIKSTKLSFYKNTDKALDFQLDLELVDGVHKINTQKMQKGKWEIELSFLFDDKLHIVKEIIVL